MAPTYYLNDYTRKSDVYSVGIILLIIVSGRRSKAVKAEDKSLEFLLYHVSNLRYFVYLVYMVINI